MRALSIDCGLSPLTCILMEIEMEGLNIRDRGSLDRVRILHMEIKEIELDGRKPKDMSLTERTGSVISFMEEIIYPLLREGDIILIEKQIPAASRSSASSIPYDCFIAMWSFFSMKGLSSMTHQVHPLLKNKVNLGAEISPPRSYSTKYATNKAIAIARLDYIAPHLGGISLPREKKTRSHVADAILQCIGWIDHTYTSG